MRERLAPRLAPLLALGTLILLFAWIYGRFAPALHFVLDDPIETEVALARPWLAAVTGSFTGEINWSGYRPLTYVLRATLAHLFGTRQMAGYFQSVDARHGDIQQHQVGLGLRADLQGVVAIGSLANHIHPRKLGQQRAQTLACQWLVIGDYYLHTSYLAHGSPVVATW